MTPATNEADLLRAQIESLNALYHAPPLKLSAFGGGLPDEKSLVPNIALLITRDEVFCVLNRLRTALTAIELSVEHARAAPSSETP